MTSQQQITHHNIGCKLLI